MNKAKRALPAIMLAALMIFYTAAPALAAAQEAVQPTPSVETAVPTAAAQGTENLTESTEAPTEQTQDQQPAAEQAVSLSTAVSLSAPEGGTKKGDGPCFVNGVAPGQILIKENSGVGWSLDALTGLKPSDFTLGGAFGAMTVTQVQTPAAAEDAGRCSTIVLVTSGKVATSAFKGAQLMQESKAKGTVQAAPGVFKTDAAIDLEIGVVTPALTVSSLQADGRQVTAIPADAGKIKVVLQMSGDLEDFTYFYKPGADPSREKTKNALAYLVLKDGLDSSQVTISGLKVTGAENQQIAFTLMNSGSLSGEVGSITVPADQNAFDENLTVSIPIAAAAAGQENVSPADEAVTASGQSTPAEKPLAYETDVTPTLAFTALKADGKKITNLSNSTINAGVTTLSGTITIGPEGRDWYFCSLTGQKNVLNSLRGEGAFEGASFSDIKVNATKPNEFSFSMTTDALGEDRTGTIVIAGAQNRFGKDARIAVGINRPYLALADSGITVKTPKAEDMVEYEVVFVVVSDGLTGGIRAKDISFDNAFEGAVIDSVETSKTTDEIKVKIIFKKKVNRDATRPRQGNLILAGGTVKFDDGSVYNRPISLALTDDFKPSVISKDSDGGITLNGKKIGADFAKSTAAFAITAAKEFVSATLKPFMGFGGIINLFIDLFSGGYNQQTDNRLSELMDQVEKISVQLDESTAAIIQNADANQLKNHVTKVSDSASALRRGYYDYYNANAIKALNLINGGVSSDADSQTVKDYLQAVYCTDTANYGYLTAFKLFGDQIVGDGTIMSNRDIFTVNEAVLANAHNWNTQTFAGRESFNKSVLSFYGEGYAVLRTAIQYDYDYHQGVKNDAEAVIAELNAAKASPQDLQPGDAALIESTLSTYQIAVRKANDSMAQDKKQMAILDATRGKVDAAVTAAQSRLSAEKAEFAGGAIKSYRINAYFKKDLESVRITSNAIKSLKEEYTGQYKNHRENMEKPTDFTGMLSEAQWDILRRGAGNRGLDYVKDMQDARFTANSGVLTEQIGKKECLGFYLSRQWKEKYGGCDTPRTFEEVTTLTDRGAQKTTTVITYQLLVTQYQYGVRLAYDSSTDEARVLILKVKGAPATGLAR